ncbi:MAG TPA: damage-inducible protein J [Spirochaetia bacterium]|nr:damage-inducible protein J [Spirochaetia bacterium]HBI39209.1 damage-inducible protein J [Spirochaetia bacterium]
MENIKIPNAITEQTFKDTDNGINLIHCKDTSEMFSKLGI